MTLQRTRKVGAKYGRTPPWPWEHLIKVPRGPPPLQPLFNLHKVEQYQSLLVQFLEASHE